MWVFLAIAYLCLPFAAVILAIIAFNRVKSLQGKLEQNLDEVRNFQLKLTQISSRLESIDTVIKNNPETQPNNIQTDIISEEQKETENTVASEADNSEPEEETSSEDKETVSDVNDATSEPDILETPSQEEAQWVNSASNGTSSPKRQSGLPDMESFLGGRWSILLGGLTLVLGLIFLVRHTIEAGLFGPAARIALGAFFSTVLLGGGEWLRRRDKISNLKLHEKADIPSILTATGSIGLFATIYAAHSLYDFIGPASAFLLLTVAGLLTMLLSVIHGPKLAAIGALGSYISPFLVSSGDPNILALSFHVLTVTTVVVTIAHLRNWVWLAISGMIASNLWAILIALSSAANTEIGGTLLVIGITLIFATLFFIRESNNLEDQPLEKTSLLAFGLLTLSFAFQPIFNDTFPTTAVSLTISLILIGLAIYRPSLSANVMWATVITLLTLASSELPFKISDGLDKRIYLTEGFIPDNIKHYIMNGLLLCVPPSLLALWGARKNALKADKASGWLSTSVNLFVFGGLLIAYLRIAPFETRPLFGITGVFLAVFLASLSEYFIRLIPDNEKAPQPAAFAVGAVACLSFANAVSWNIGWISLAFALTTLGITLIYRKRPLFVLPPLSLLSAGLSGLALLITMPQEIMHLSKTLIFNGLIPLIALPAFAFLASGEILRRSKEKAFPYIDAFITSAGLALTALFVGLELIHFINSGNLYNAQYSLAETAALTLAGLGFTFGLQKYAAWSQVKIYDDVSYTAGIISVLFAGFGLFIAFNPLITDDPVGKGGFFNLLLPSYLLTGLLAAFVAKAALPVRQRQFTLLYAGFSGVLLFFYFSLSLRKFFQGSEIGLSHMTSDLEFWLYSPLWFSMGVFVLVIGLYYKLRFVRLISALLIILTILKVFLFDMSELTGILRAFSFIGLGLSLILIGRFYQHVLLQQSNTEKS